MGKLYSSSPKKNSKKEKKNKEAADIFSPFFDFLKIIVSFFTTLFSYLIFFPHIFTFLLLPTQFEATLCYDNWNILSNVCVFVLILPWSKPHSSVANDGLISIDSRFKSFSEQELYFSLDFFL